MICILQKRSGIGFSLDYLQQVSSIAPSQYTEAILEYGYSITVISLLEFVNDLMIFTPG